VEGGTVRILNKTQTLPLGRSEGRSIEAVVRISGIDARAGGRGFVYERRDPQAVVVRGEDDLSRIEIRPADGVPLIRMAAPVAAYLLTRIIFRRRRKQ
jgi:hypothetical protein